MSWDIRGKNVLVTGGNSGIGKATARALASQGARVTITSRDAAKGRQAVADIEQVSGTTVSVGSLDLSSLASVRRFAGEFVEQHAQLDILVNNAGLVSGARQETIDGFEWTFGVNHLGPFLLTNLLKPSLAAPSRIINVSSDAHRSAKEGLDFDDLQMTSGYKSFRAYAASKLANILFTVELANRWGGDDITAHAVHPGVVATGFGRDKESPSLLGFVTRLLGPFIRKPDRGAATNVFLATAPADIVGTGQYWYDSKPAQPISSAKDPAAAKRLWAESESLVGLS